MKRLSLFLDPLYLLYTITLILTILLYSSLVLIYLSLCLSSLRYPCMMSLYMSIYIPYTFVLCPLRFPSLVLSYVRVLNEEDPYVWFLSDVGIL